MAEAIEQADGDDEQAKCDRMTKIVDSHCIQLMEHFDCVRIFVVRKHSDPDKDLWSSLSRGRGNWYGQKGAVDDWVMTQDARTKHEAIRPDDDE